MQQQNSVFPWTWKKQIFIFILFSASFGLSLYLESWWGGDESESRFPLWVSTSSPIPAVISGGSPQGWDTGGPGRDPQPLQELGDNFIAVSPLVYIHPAGTSPDRRFPGNFTGPSRVHAQGWVHSLVPQKLLGGVWGRGALTYQLALSGSRLPCFVFAKHHNNNVRCLLNIDQHTVLYADTDCSNRPEQNHVMWAPPPLLSSDSMFSLLWFFFTLALPGVA